MGRLIAVLVFLTILPFSAGASADDGDPNRSLREALQVELEDFSAPGWDRRTEGWDLQPPGTGVFLPVAGPALTRYRERLIQGAGWTGGPVWHQAGTIQADQPGRLTERLGLNVFFPPGEPKGTLLFVHGYLSHAANFAYTAAWFTARGWRVVTLDLPGHGLSTGPRGDIEAFSGYGAAVRLWLDWVHRQGWAGPTALVAHSLGSAACLEAFRDPRTLRPDRIVFCAPLLRTDWFQGLSLVQAATAGWLREIPSTFGWDGYLDGYRMPVHWFEALGRWLESLEGQTPLSLPLTVFSGDRDTVVDEGWNLAEYRRLVPGVRETVLPGKDHLFLSNKKDREAFHLLLGQTVGALEPFRWTETTKLPVVLGPGRSVTLETGVFRPRGPSRGTLLFVHGYRANKDQFGPLLGWFADRGWTVAALDLPGHGASEGPRAAVDDFGDYGSAVARWLDWAGAQGWPGPTVLLAHSLGTSACLEALGRPDTKVPDQVVFCAPLLRTDWFGLVQWAGATGSSVAGAPPARWLAALVRWETAVENRPPLHLPLTVYSGDADPVVDETWNLTAYRRMVPGVRIERLPGRDHWFLQKAGAREEFLLRLQRDLGL